MRAATVRDMTVQRMHHVGVVVNDLAAATAFFSELGLEREGEGTVEGAWVDRIIGLEGVRSDVAMMATPDGQARIELCKFHSPAAPDADPKTPSNAPGIRHLTFEVDDVDGVVERLRSHGAELVGTLENYEDIYRLCYIRGPEGIIVELAERLG